MNIVEYRGWKIPKDDNFIKKHLQDYPINNNQDKIINFVRTLDFKKNLVIDIGANIGTKATQFATFFNQVICFEPVSINFLCLKENTKKIDNVKIYNYGISNKKSKEKIILPTEFINHYGAFSIDKFSNRNDSAISEEIDVDFIDNFSYSPNLIKIDVEGHESKVLEGAYNTIKKYKPALIIEHSSKNVGPIMEILKPLGYNVTYSKQKDNLWICK